jgi:hypothetical protein
MTRIEIRYASSEGPHIIEIDLDADVVVRGRQIEVGQEHPAKMLTITGGQEDLRRLAALLEAAAI